MTLMGKNLIAISINCLINCSVLSKDLGGGGGGGGGGGEEVETRAYILKKRACN